VAVGWWAYVAAGSAPDAAAGAWVTIPVLVAVLSRKGILPLHLWLPGFFERGPFRLALLWSMPQAGVYLAARILLPSASAAAIGVLAWLSLATAVYAAGLALVQTDARRWFGYFFMSQSALVLVGLGRMTTLGMTAGLTLWLAGSVSMTGLGLVIWALEARRGRLTLDAPHGGFAQTPHLAVCFLIMGLTSVGFPGTLGFIGQELLVDAVLEQRSFAGAVIMTAIVCNGITMLRVYGLLFCGKASRGQHGQRMRLRERIGVLVLAALVILFGIAPQGIVRTREAAATRILAAEPAERE
jgi:NADH-quinone oxidoreductase subunit M